MTDDKKQNSKNLYTYLMFEKFWNEHKEFLKLQIKYGPIPLKRDGSKFYGKLKKQIVEENEAKDKITAKRQEYYSSLSKISMRAFDDLKEDNSLCWDNKNVYENKIKEATWLTFNLLIDRCNGEGEWGRVAEVFKIIISLLCGNDNKLPYSAMEYMFFVLSSDISLQAIYKGLSLLYKDENDPSDNYNVSDYELETIPKHKIDDEKLKEYKYWETYDKKNGKYVKEDLTAGTLVTDLRKYRYRCDVLPNLWNRKNIQRVPNVLVCHRNYIIHGSYSITDHFQKEPEAYKNRLAGIVYDYVTTVFYLREYIDTVWNDQMENPGKYSSGQNKRTFEKFVSEAHGIIEGIVTQLGVCEVRAKALSEKEKTECEVDLHDVSKHYAFIVNFGSKVNSGELETPEGFDKILPAILSDPGSVEKLMERLKAVNAENNDKLKEELTIAFKKFLDDNHAKLEQQYVKLNAEIMEMEKSMAQMQSDISGLKEGQHDIAQKIDDTKEKIEERLIAEFNKIYDSIIHDINVQLKQMSKKVNFIARVAERLNNLFDKLNIIKKRTLDYSVGALAVVPMLCLIGLFVYLLTRFSIGFLTYDNTCVNVLYLLHKTSVHWIFTGIILLIAGLLFYALKKKVKINRVVILIAAGWLAVFFIYGKLFVGFKYENENEFFNEGPITDWEMATKYIAPSLLTSIQPSLMALTERYLKENPDNENALYSMASYDILQKDYDEAFNLLSAKNNPQHYPYLSELYVKVCFLLGRYSEAWDNIDKYGGKYPTGIAAVAGVMHVYGLGCDTNPSLGKSILKQAADAGDVFAQLHYGDVITKDTDKFFIENGKINIEITDFSFGTGIYYLREASRNLPDACILLGNLYNDLNMVDSALFYYNKAHDWILTEDMKSELVYKIGQAKNKIKDGDGDEEIEEAVERNYQPAIIYAAERVKDTQRAIDYYEKRMPVYKGFRYISPLSIKYLEKNSKQKALEALQKSRPNGGFNEDFIEGLGHMLGTGRTAKDSIKGIEKMRLSAAKGCQYAEMLCNYRDLENFIDGEKLITHKDLNNLGIEKFMEYGDSIPFANVLLSHLYYKAGLTESAVLATVSAIREGHPAGAYFMSHIFTAKELSKIYKNDTDSLKRNTDAHLAFLRPVLRYAINKENVLLPLALWGGGSPNDSTERIYENIVIANKCYNVMKALLLSSNNKGVAPSVNLLRSFLESVNIAENDTLTLDLLVNAFVNTLDLPNIVEYDQLLDDDKNPNSVLIKKRLIESAGRNQPTEQLISVQYTQKRLEKIRFSDNDIIEELGFIGDNYISNEPYN